MKTPTLARVDLRKAREHDHPDISTKKWYLARIDGWLFVGKFSRQWYGLSFDDGWGASGHQFDAPGYNRSRWQDLWEIKEAVRGGRP